MHKHEECFAQLAGAIREQTTEHHTIWSLAYGCSVQFSFCLVDICTGLRGHILLPDGQASEQPCI